MRPTLWLGISAVAISMTRRAQQPASLDTRVTAVLARIASQDLATRHAGLDDLIAMISDAQKLGFDPEYIPALQDMAQHDPFVIPGDARYPLRDRAKRLWEKIANH